MRRVVSLWFPTWPTDRLRRSAGVWPDDMPLVTSAHDGRRLVIAAADRTALALGLHPGVPLAQAQAMVPGLAVVEADRGGDLDALRRTAAWCLRYAPFTAAAPPDGIWIDATGCTHLRGGEQAMLADMASRLDRAGFTARAAIADTPGAAYAVARHGHAQITVVPAGAAATMLSGLPIAGLRLDAGSVAGLGRLGFECIGQLADAPRAPLVRRFGKQVALRLDQVFGEVFEPIQPTFPPDVVGHRLTFVEPLLTAEAFSVAITELVRPVCVRLAETGQGARRLDLLFERVDGTVQAISIGTARPSHDNRHLARLLQEKIASVDPGLGVEAMRLVVPLLEPFTPLQTRALLGEAEDADIATLVDRLENRLGAGRVYRTTPVESDVPERSVRYVPALAAPAETSWPPSLPRPVRLLDPPRPVDAIALLPDQPLVAFTWRRKRHKVRRADGPERIFGEWWRRSTEVAAVRDYFAVEDEDGRRFWLFRRGDGADPATGDLSWFLHGLF
jgi:protein ImuB